MARSAEISYLSQPADNLYTDLNLSVKPEAFLDKLKPLAISPSDFEVILPFLALKQQGEDAACLLERHLALPSETGERAKRGGTLLHDADALYALIAREISPEELHIFLPGVRDTDRRAIARALTAAQSHPDPETQFLKGWECLFDEKCMWLAGTRMLFSRSRDEPDTTEEFLEATRVAGDQLAHAWFTNVHDETAKEFWEFDPRARIFREVSATVRTKIGLTLNARLDSVAVSPVPYDGRQYLQVCDVKFKTKDEGVDFVMEQQAKLMEIIAGALYNALIRPNGIPDHPMAKLPKTPRMIPQKSKHLRFYFRSVYRDTGNMDESFLYQSDDQKQEFYRWLTWLSLALHKYYDDWQLFQKGMLMP